MYPFETPQSLGPRRPSQDYWSRSIKKGGSLAGEIIYWEKSAPTAAAAARAPERRGGEGRVLNVGTIQAAPAMLRDATLSALVSNALHHMCGRAPCARSLPALGPLADGVGLEACEALATSGEYGDAIQCYVRAGRAMRAGAPAERLAAAQLMLVMDAVGEADQAAALALAVRRPSACSCVSACTCTCVCGRRMRMYTSSRQLR